MSKTFGYGRVSTGLQTSENQKQAIEASLGIQLDEWYEDHAVSGKTKAADRPMFAKMLSEVKKGDTVVFSRVDRVGRRTSDVLLTVEGLIDKGVNVYILQVGKEPLNTPMGKVILGVFAIIAENERDSNLERTRDGLIRAEKAGKIFGPKLVMPPDVLTKCCQGRKQGSTLQELSDVFDIPKNTISRNIIKWGEKLEEYEKEWDKRELQYKNKRAA